MRALVTGDSYNIQDIAHSAAPAAAEQELVRRGRVKTGDVLGVVAGTQMASGSTNFMRLHLVTAEEERGISRQKGLGKKAAATRTGAMRKRNA